MKIGVLTYFRLANYGANLQAFSTYCYLRNSGYDVLFIDWAPDEYYDLKIRNTYNNPATKNHFEFVDSFFPISKSCKNDEDICQTIIDEKIDAVIIGSDAILQNHPFWERVSFPSRKIVSFGKPFVTTTYPSPFWGSFIDYLPYQIPVVVMSGSSQDSKYYLIWGGEKARMSDSIQKFSYMSVRDSWTQKMIKHITNDRIIPPITPDPVFALNQNAKDFIPSKETVLAKYNLPEKYVLFSFWNNNIVSKKWLSVIGDLFAKDSIVPVAFPMPGGVRFDHPFKFEINTPTPLEWYSLIANATAYIGEKMHPIVVCLANSVPCFSFDHCGLKFLKGLIRYSKSSKIFDLMNGFGICDNRVNGTGLFVNTPSPESVFDKILSFNRDDCSRKASDFLNRYNDMMQDIISIMNDKYN